MSETNVLAIAAIAMSAVSLAWQASSWLLSGPVIRALITLSHDRVIVTVYNSGRAAATITAVSVRIDQLGVEGGVKIASTPLPESDPVPFRIPEGGHASWQYEVSSWAFRRTNKPSRSYRYLKVHFYANVTVGLNKQVSADLEGWGYKA